MLKNYIPAIIWAILILALSISPTVQLPESFFSPDKLGHLIFYGVLTWLILLGKKSNDVISKKFIYFTVSGCSLYGFGIECIQYAFFPNRYFEIEDIIANIIGCFLAKIIFEIK